MPQYEFECPGCGRTETRITTLADRPKTLQCPDCFRAMEWVPQRLGQVFKGGGWAPRFHPE